MKKTKSLMSFSSAFVEKRTAKNTFYKQLNLLIDWQVIDNEINRVYNPKKSAVGQPPYSGLLLFKMLLLSVWNGSLSDRAVEELVNENLSAMRFCGLTLEDCVPDHSVLSRFRSHLAALGAFDKLMSLINIQLEKHSIIVKTGIKIDATITDSPRKPKGKTTYVIAEDRKEDEVNEEDKQAQSNHIKAVKVVQAGVDEQARWIKKGGNLHYGYKEHVATDENGLVVSVETTPANEHDSLSFESLVTKADVKENTGIFADKAYKSAKHDTYLKEKKLKNRVHHKASKSHKLSKWEQEFNRLVSKQRYTVERTFGSKVRWFKTGTAKYIGKIKTHAQHLIESIAYNLKRSPVLYIKAQIAANQMITA
jgi:transposase, IS5 family